MENINVDELHDLISGMGNEELILDVRTPAEFSEGHIPGARNQDHESVTSIANELKKYKTVYVHCKMGGRAQKAAAELEKAGLTNIVCVNQGGMHRWMEMGWETEQKILPEKRKNPEDGNPSPGFNFLKKRLKAQYSRVCHWVTAF